MVLRFPFPFRGWEILVIWGSNSEYMTKYEILAGGAREAQSFLMLFEVTAPSEPVAKQMLVDYGLQNQLGELSVIQLKDAGPAEGTGPRVKQLSGRGFLDF